MEKLLIEQEELVQRVNRSLVNYKKTGKDRLTSSFIETKLENLESAWKRFTTNHYELIVSISKNERAGLPYFSDDWYELLENVYTDFKTKMKGDLKTKQIHSNTTKDTTSTTCSMSATEVKEVKLPQINLPIFCGEYQDWQSFNDMFVTLIHNNQNLSPVQKLHYLKSSLKGEPESLLRSLSTTDDNYNDAWEKLKRRYNNKRYNCNEILKQMFSQKPIMFEDAAGIKSLLDVTSSCLKSINNLGINTNSWDVIIIHLILSKLNYETRREWETELGRSPTDEFPTWDQFVKFLEMRFRTLEMLGGIKQPSKPNQSIITKHVSKQRSFHSTVQEQNKENNKVCIYCSNSQHLLYQCKQFGNKSPEERSEFVQNKRLCFNCLSSTHNVKSCHLATSCRRCGKRHHTLLHFERSTPLVSTGVPPPSINIEPPHSARCVALSTSIEPPHSARCVAPNTSIEPPHSARCVAPSTSVERAHSARCAAPSPPHPPGHSERNVVAHFAKEEQRQGKVLLATALVRVKSANGYKQTARVLIDQGSEASFVTESTVQSLALKRVPVNGLVSGVGDGQLRTKHTVTFDLESLYNSEFCVSINAFVLTSLTSFLPSSKTSILDWPELDDLPLADPQYGTPAKIDIILGVDAYSQIILSGLLRHPSHSGPVAQNTQLGWILSGRVDNCQNEMTARVVNLHLQVKEDTLLKQFWEIEREPDLVGKKLTKEESRCEEIYESTTRRNSEGRYVVRLPFRESVPKCVYGRSLDIAVKRFKLLEKKLKKNPVLQVEYGKVLIDYLQQEHMELIENQTEIEKPTAVYLPHHAVVREDRDTSKVRIVYDASCKGVNNVSLNDSLMIGPRLQQDLRHILMRWRTHPYCIMADIAQMYRQVVVNEEDVNYQRIVWRDDPEQPIQHYKLLRLTFGTACAPYLAVKSLQQLAKDEQVRYPTAAKITLTDYYMDDLITGCQTVDEAIHIYHEMDKLMREGGFKLQKWCSNSNELLEYIEKDKQRSNETFIFKPNETVKVLGIHWNKITDNFEYNYNLPEQNEPESKRKILSNIARLYDPMGWVAPVIVTAKIFMQKLWKSGLGWDDHLTPELLKEWVHFREDLNNMKEIVLPRWLSLKKEDPVELHVFADASQVAYAAVVYLKSRDKEGNTHVNIVTAKTKVAPIEKEISIPRLELCAALLGAKLIFEVAQILNVPKDKLFAWSDSMVVLAWLKGEPSRWTTFVSNRVSEILTILEPEQWNHVTTDLNPADCASRGMTVGNLREHDLWWHGSRKINESHIYTTDIEVSTNEEERSIKALTTTLQPKKEDFIWKRFSNLNRMLRVLSFCRKFLQLSVPPSSRVMDKIVTVKEMDDVLKICVKATQEFYFEEEIKQLRSESGCVSKKSQLHTLSPFIDQDGLLRVGGRIDHSSVQFDKKHPLILPSESHLTKLIISDTHHRTFHGGPQIMMNVLRSKYWIIRAREKVKKFYRNCVTCVRYSRQNNSQFMGQLPKTRITPDKPFRSSGVDFTGYINIRFSPGRGSKSYKGYICVFVCMVTKAIHLEAVSDLTANGFIAAFRRFVSRRGRCQHLYSDNGTNFVGADKELQEMFNRAKSQLPNEIAHLLTEEGTTWHFIPPHAPNFGGLWEAGVRSTKTHLKRVIGDATLTFEELTTVLTQVEACLNSRPLSYLSDNAEDPMPLTPGHFLVGEPLVTIPDEDYTRSSISGLQRWKLTQKMVNDFWHKWSNEYLVTLNNRYKWFTKRAEPDVNDIVLLRDDNLPPTKWLLGKIVERHPGKDNITRVVSVKTKNGVFKRPCNKLSFLPKESC